METLYSGPTTGGDTRKIERVNVYGNDLIGCGRERSTNKSTKRGDDQHLRESHTYHRLSKIIKVYIERVHGHDQFICSLSVVKVKQRILSILNFFSSRVRDCK